MSGLVLGYLGCVLLVLTITITPFLSKKGSLTHLSNRMRTVYVACRHFADDNGDMLPGRLEELVDRGYLDDPGALLAPAGVEGLRRGEPAFRLLVPGERYGHLVPWHPIIISKSQVGNGRKWIAILADGGISTVGPDLYDPETGVRTGAIDRYRDWR